MQEGYRTDTKVWKSRLFRSLTEPAAWKRHPTRALRGPRSVVNLGGCTRMSQMRRRFGCVALALLAAVFVATGTSAAATVSDSNWTIQSLPTPAVAPNGQLMGTSCTSDSLCMAVGVAQDSL